MKRINILIFEFIIFRFACSGDINKILDKSLSELPAEAIVPLKTEADLDPLLEKIRDSRIVLLAEASHGTSEFIHGEQKSPKGLFRKRIYNAVGTSFRN